MKLYAIWDKREQKFFVRGPKVTWARAGAAKNAVMYDLSGIWREDFGGLLRRKEISQDWLKSKEFKRRHLSFADQLRYECREYDLAAVEWRVV